MLGLYLAYMCRNKLSPFQPSVLELSEFLEYLVAANYTPKTIKAYITVIRRYHLQQDCAFTAGDSFQIREHLAGIDRTVRHRIRQAPAISPRELKLVLTALRAKNNSEVFIFAFTLAFTTFVRQANLAPHSSRSFDETRHTRRQDIVKTETGYGLRVFWTKTRQQSTAPDIIPLPVLKGDILCPTAAWLRYKKATLLVIKEAQQFETVTINLLSEVLRLTRIEADLKKPFTLHSLRRGGTVVCYKEGATIPDLMQHGTWASQAIWAYLAKECTPHSTVMKAWDQIAANQGQH